MRSECSNVFTSPLTANGPVIKAQSAATTSDQKTGVAERKKDKRRQSVLACLLQRNCVTEQDVRVHVVSPDDVLYLRRLLNMDIRLHTLCSLIISAGALAEKHVCIILVFGSSVSTTVQSIMLGEGPLPLPSTPSE